MEGKKVKVIRPGHECECRFGVDKTEKMMLSIHDFDFSGERMPNLTKAWHIFNSIL